MPHANATDYAESDSGVPKVTICSESFETYVDARRIPLTLTEFKILKTLAHRPGWTHSPEDISRQVSRDGSPIRVTAIKKHIWSMRKKLGPGGQNLQTVRGDGYRVNGNVKVSTHGVFIA